MSPRIRAFVLVSFSLCALAPVRGADVTVQFQNNLTSRDATAQIVVQSDRDLTRAVRYKTEPEGIVSINENGWVKPLRDGTAILTIEHAGTTLAKKITVTGSNEEKRYSFPNDILPVITRNSCNAGACHAKIDAQNAYSLSLFGYDPRADYEVLVKHSRGRRISVASPETSLFLLKASGTLPHEGGARLDPESEDYRKILTWISQGARYQPENDPSVKRIGVFPRDVVALPGEAQQVAVLAYYDDGSVRDITRVSQFEANQPEMASVDESGLITFKKKAGTASVMIRFREHVGVLRAVIPMARKETTQPKPNNYIDEEIFRQLSLLGIPASDLSSDGEFLRRVTIDIAGRLPSLAETESFLASNDAKKRSKKIAELLDTTDYADFFAGKWAGILRNKATPSLDWVFRETFSFHSWIRQSFLDNKPFDQFARELVTASGKSSDNPAVGWYRNLTDPKERMEDIAQVFLGIRMACAQCHHHPYEQWSQDDYYGFAAFFTTVDRKAVYKLPEDDLIYHNRKPAEILNPATKAKVKPTVPGGGPIGETPPEIDPRFALADWMCDPKNPYFAKALVNRYWKHFFGRGLVEPEDDIRPTNPATHPALFERLTEGFAASGFDIKKLITKICNSRSYQLSSAPKGDLPAADDQNYARYYPRRLQAEVLLDAFNEITGSQNSFNRQPLGVRAVALPDDSSNKESQFLTLFGRPQMDTACECERTPEANLGQSLTLINSDLIQRKIADASGRAKTLGNDNEKSLETSIRELYLIGFCREPKEEETARATNYIEQKIRQAADGGKISESAARIAGFEDLIWVLANTKEFMFNH